MRAVGIDSSLTMTGFATISPEGEPLVVRFPSRPDDNSIEDISRRITYITGKALLAAPGPCLTVIEKPIIPEHKSGQVLERGGLFHVLAIQFLRRGPVVIVHPMTRAKYATGRGNAKKADVLAAMRARFPGLALADDNAADGLALACMGARFLGFPADGEPSKQQLEAMTAVRWQPTPKEKK
jgi:Holliday junction resolvasome RuvABC endonuclease subunit